MGLRVAWLGQRSDGAGDGLVTYSREITRALRRRGAEVVFVHHHAASASPGAPALDSLPVGSRVRIAPPGSGRRLAGLLRRERPDVVHVSLSFSSLDFSLPAICHELGLPVAATFHAPFDTHATMWAGLSRILYQLYALPLARYDRVIVFGPSQRRLLARLGVPDAAIRVVPNGVDVDRYRPGPSDWRERLGARRVFAYLGRLDREKNVDVLLDSFLEVDPPAGIRLAVAGDGPERQRLARRARDPRVAMLGPVRQESERIGLLRAADAVFLPSAIEGLSLALLEGMACGACPVATEVGCDGDAVRGAGILLDPVHLRAQLRLAVRLLTSAPEIAADLGRRARERVVERYTLGANVDALLGIYDEMLVRRGARTAPGG